MFKKLTYQILLSGMSQTFDISYCNCDTACRDTTPRLVRGDATA